MSYRNYIQMGAQSIKQENKKPEPESSSSSSGFYDDMIEDLKNKRANYMPKQRVNRAKYIDSDSMSSSDGRQRSKPLSHGSSAAQSRVIRRKSSDKSSSYHRRRPSRSYSSSSSSSFASIKKRTAELKKDLLRQQQEQAGSKRVWFAPNQSASRGRGARKSASESQQTSSRSYDSSVHIQSSLRDQSYLKYLQKK